MYLELKLTGKKCRYYRYLSLAMPKILTRGQYPLIRLTEAIKKRDEVKALRIDNINPITHCTEKKVGAKNTCTNTFKRIIQESIKVKMANQAHLYSV